MYTMSSSRFNEGAGHSKSRGERSHSSQGLPNAVSSPALKIPNPPRLWITDIEGESSDGSEISARDDGQTTMDRPRVRSRFRHYKQRYPGVIPIGIYWDIENCQVPRGCSAIDVVAAIRNKFLVGRRESEFIVVCDVRKEVAFRLQELNDAQVNLIHVCASQKNAADEKLRQCMRRFGELHTQQPAALLLISGDINFAADLSDFRHRKNMEVILVHKQNTSSALIACACSHYCFNDLTDKLPRKSKRENGMYQHQQTVSQCEVDEPPCEVEVLNLPIEQTTERVSRRLRRLADNCGGKVMKVAASSAILKFPTPDFASRALQRMDGEDVFGRKISTRYARGVFQAAYSSDEGYSTGTAAPAAPRAAAGTPVTQIVAPLPLPQPANGGPDSAGAALAADWAAALQRLPAATPPCLDFCPPPPAPAALPARPRQIRGTHGSNQDRSGCSSSVSGDEGRRDASRAASPWNCSGSASEHSEADDATAELTVANLPPYDLHVLQEMVTQLFSQYVQVARVSVWAGADGPLASVALRSESDARLAIARVHKRRLDAQWTGRRLELSLGRPSPAANPDALRGRLRAILLEQPGHCLPLLRLRDAYASRHCSALTTADLAKFLNNIKEHPPQQVKDTVLVHDGFGRVVQLLDLRPVPGGEADDAPWKCRLHASGAHDEDGSGALQPVCMEVAALAANVEALVRSHGGILPLLSFVECYQSRYPPLVVDAARGVPLELLLLAAPSLELRDCPSRHITLRQPRAATPRTDQRISESSRCSGVSNGSVRTAPALEPLLTLFERELADLLRTAPRCCIPFSKLIPAFHHHFGRQCRVADYGFTKLPELLAALSNTIVVLGSGSSRVITLSAAAQGRRWTSNLVKLIKSQPNRSILPHDLPLLYQAAYGQPFSPTDYGVCTMAELMQRVTPNTLVIDADGAISLPRATPTPEEKARAAHFAMQALELLCHTANLRMEFSRFVPAYHAHFGRQLRVAHFGVAKLAELFELVPGAVAVCADASERAVKLAALPAKSVMATRIQRLSGVPLSALGNAYAAAFGAAPAPDALSAPSLEALVYAAGGCVEAGVVRGPVDSQRWASAKLAAAAALTADRSVARGSTQEYFASAYRRLTGTEPQLTQLEWSGVVTAGGMGVGVGMGMGVGLQLTAAWRAVWRVAGVLEAGPLQPHVILTEYTQRYDAGFEDDVKGLVSLLRAHPCVFSMGAGGAWAVAAAVAPRPRAIPRQQDNDYSLFDTPPGQKGSRVFDSPKMNIWCSPPASALPAPTAFLCVDNKRRTRLAAQFDSAQLDEE